MREQRLREALLDARIPGEREARERGWRLVRAAYVASPPAVAPRRRSGGRRAWQAALAAALVVAAISPAGAAVRHWVGGAEGRGTRRRFLR